MEDIANISSKQQAQTQGSTPKAVSKQAPVSLVKEIQQEVSKPDKKINSSEDVQNLVDNLNKAIAPISTNLSFGVDKDDIFYVSVTDVSSDKVIRRFPAEKAADFLPKMQEVTGILFDSLG